MRFSVVADYAAMSRAAADLVLDAARDKPDLLLCAASGDTPTGTYQALAGARAVLAAIRVIQLDEWSGLAAGDPASCESYVRRQLLEPLEVDAERAITFRSDAPDADAECARVRAELESSGPIDVCILGLGRNGHLALNEPADALTPHCHVATLAETSRDHPMLNEARAPVTAGLTLGMAEILQARTILLLVSGAAKREPLARLAEARITPHHPASFLWLHPATLCLCDSDAAQGLALTDG